MAKQLKLRRGTTTEHSTFTGAEGEVTVDTTKDTVVVHDGVTAGGVPLAKESAIPTGALASKNTVATADIDNDAVTTAKIADANVTTAKIADANVTGAKIANDAIDSQHYAADSIDAEHYAPGSVDTTALADSSVTSAKIVDGTIVAGDIADATITGTKIATDTITATNIAENAVGASELNVTGNGTAGQFLSSDGDGTMTWADAGGGASPRTELFTAPGTWTKPAGASYVEVVVIGGGGGSPADSFNPAGNAGGTSSFGSLVSATGGNGSNTGANTGNPGNGTVSAGTAIKTGAILPKINTTTGPTASNADQRDSTYNPFKTIGGIAGNCGGNTSNNLTYSTSSKQIAGSAGWVGNHHAGGGGVAWASYVPVTGPVAVTVGAGGNSAGPISPNSNEGGSVAGAVWVKWWE